MSKLRRTVPRTLGIEMLEPRQVMAALITPATITAALDGSVLRVEGSEGNDRIVFRQSDGRITIDGVNRSWSGGKVDSVAINLLAGSDFVSMRQLRGFDVSITSGGGEEHARLADGRDVYFAGIGETLDVHSGIATLNGEALDWFDTHLSSDMLRDAARSRFDDRLFDRWDMVEIFDEAAAAGTVTTRVFNSLSVLVGKTSMFGELDYVQFLSKCTVRGNKANAHFQGELLGNLQIGSSGGHLTALVDKWFFGLDYPTNSVFLFGQWQYFNYAEAAGQLFVDGVQYTDVRQGILGDCYLMGSLAETALRRPEIIEDMFIDNGDGTFTVRYFKGSTAQYVTVDRYLPVNTRGQFIFANKFLDADDPDNELWAALAEKAYVQMNESGWLRSASDGGGQNAYWAITGGWGDDTLRQITGWSAVTMEIGPDRGSFSSFLTLYRAGKLITFGTNSQAPDSRLVDRHEYAVVGCDVTTKTITLYNPWGIDADPNKPGIIHLTWSQIRQNFNSCFYTL